ncbi:aminotransferase class V-fold PLP-dependent enzyme [Salinicola lusitanus]|uniref:aminotransferase class V-fold PLP-dependent enzyme n=1 Tax=Salinicola lusitanus TaxID=1949085 RepID=UPI000DA26394|nr:aminotransferase class V-fold PLP-dependent enzyme [Salinicola lusitanus]
MTTLADFRRSLSGPDLLTRLREGLIGNDMPFVTPFGERRLLYADYVASGRALRQVERFISEEVLPFYANSHTEASHCGQAMTRLRQEARALIARALNAEDCHVVFSGSGATAGINRIVALLDIAARVRRGERVSVLVGPYEHHSNLLPWRESGAVLVEIPEGDAGGPDTVALERALDTVAGSDLIVGAFSAASNVTGIVSDVDDITRRLKRHGALAVWDYAGGGPYLAMDMAPAPDCRKDAIVFSPHKFVGGPGASGVMVVRDTLVHRRTPSLPGGGTVSFVSPWTHHYSSRLEAREESGTPNVVGDIRAALALLVKEAIGLPEIARRDADLRRRGLARWADEPRLELLGRQEVPALPIFSFRVRDADGGLIHHQLFTRMLSDVYGIQARGGCACAGPYAHRLLGIDAAASEALVERLGQGHELEKPGWIRLSLNVLHDDAQVERILDGVQTLAREAAAWARHYRADPVTARFRVDAAGG